MSMSMLSPAVTSTMLNHWRMHYHRMPWCVSHISTHSFDLNRRILHIDYDCFLVSGNRHGFRTRPLVGMGADPVSPAPTKKVLGSIFSRHSEPDGNSIGDLQQERLKQLLRNDLFLSAKNQQKLRVQLNLSGWVSRLGLRSLSYRSTDWIRFQSTMVQKENAGSVPSPSLNHNKVDPFQLVENDLNNLYDEIRKELWTQRPELEEIAGYYFDGLGKAFRPMIVVLVARALNTHVHDVPDLFESQKTVAMVAEMIHTASLVHDDVIDTADTRRGKSSVNVLWGQKKAILAGDYIIARSSQMLARLKNEEVIFVLSQVLLDLVQGEFMQMGAKEDESERFSHYIHKSFKKTASLIAYTCKAVSLLSGANHNFQEAAFQYGRNLGIAFQLVDDLLDFVSSQAELGKPAATDLKLGLATAPVLFACDKFPELNVMIMRRFSQPGDVQRAYEFVMKSDGLDHTRILARKHADEALRHIAPFADSPEKRALQQLAEMTLNRKK